MAKKRGFFRRAARRASKSVRRVGRSAKRGDSMLVNVAGGFAYGATRESLSQLISPVTSKVPLLGDNTDEAAIILAGTYLHGKTNNKWARSYLRSAVAIESARLGASLGSGLIGNMMGSSQLPAKSSGNVVG